MEERKQGRLGTRLECELEVDGERVGAQLLDLSTGGCLIDSVPRTLAPGAPMAIVFQQPGASSQEPVPAELVSATPLGERVRYRLRFVGGDEQERIISELMAEALFLDAVDGRSPRVYRNVLVDCRTSAEFEARLRDISKSGCLIECERDEALATAITVRVLMQGAEDEAPGFESAGEVLPGLPSSLSRRSKGARSTAEPLTLGLRAETFAGQVARVERLDGGRYLLGVRFRELTSAQDALMNDYLRGLLRLGNAA